MRTKKVLGILLIIIGAGLILFGGYAALGGQVAFGGLSVSRFGSIVPFIIGAMFFSSGIKLLNQAE
ncbi:hypothetical protein AB9P05_22550 [Roseivirga sp. BDSF3-8]|uniref:hypothetical protein n=1 Tax=Roseivirga sp. BDSF3-8 TaxID=3241598 RepID=UPI0035323B9D